MNIECDNCGNKFNQVSSWKVLFRTGSASLKCPHCQQYLYPNLHYITGVLIKAILIATGVSVLPIALMVASCSVADGFCVEQVEYFMRPKTSALGSVLLLLNFMVIFMGLAVPDLLRFRSRDQRGS